MATLPGHVFQHAGFQGQIGLARRDITPPVGVYARNWGAAAHDVAESIHRPLAVTVLTLASSPEESPLVLIDADLGWWRTPRVFEQFQSELTAALKIPAEKLIIALTHTHAGPPLMEHDPELPGATLLKTWMESLPGIIVQAAQDAISGSREAILEWHRGHCSLATVRDLPDPEAASRPPRYLCGYAPGVPADDTLWVGRLATPAGQTEAVLVNYACHPTTLAWQNRAISPDFPGAMRETIERERGATAIFLLGMCGELAPRHQYVGETEIADAHGRELGYAALSTLAGMEPPGQMLAYSRTQESGAPLAVWEHQPAATSSSLRAIRPHVSLPLKDWPTAEELEQQRRDCPDRTLAERLRRKRDIRRGLGDGSTYDLPFSVWKMGDAILIGCCCEAYSLLQQELRQRFPERPVICMNLINGSIGYLPPAESYDRDIYPVWQSPFDRGSLETLLEAMTRTIRQLLAEST